MSTKNTKTPAKAKTPKAKTPKAKTPKAEVETAAPAAPVQDLEALKLAQAETQATAKHGDKIVAGSAERDTASNKITVLIRTRGLDGEYDGNTRRVATSDVHQVHHMPEVKKEMDRARAKERTPNRQAKLEAALVAAGVDPSTVE